MNSPGTLPEPTPTQPKRQLNTILIIGGAIALLVVLLGIGLFLARPRNTVSDVINNHPTSDDNTQSSNSTKASWEYRDDQWKSNDNPPECENPIRLASPVDLLKATNILSPGQIRGGDYKPHGGFLFIGSNNNEISVKAPLTATLVRGSRYIERGETQYLLFFINDCGLAYRFDHLLTLTPSIQALVETLPEAKVDDSRTTDFDQPLKVNTGDIIATGVGFQKTNNTSVDWGVYDLRQTNKISKDLTWAQTHQNRKEQAYYALCWIEYLNDSDSAKANALPGPGTEGKKSDYCD